MSSGGIVRRRSGWIAGAAALATVLAVIAPQSALALADPAPGDITAVATLDKTTSATEVQPGQTFTYTLTVGCSAITDVGCRDAVLSDTVPAPFVLVNAVVGGGANTAAPPVISGNSVTVNWTTPLGDGTQGILDNTTGIVQITARLPEDASHDLDGVPVVNKAVIEGTNFADVDDEVAVTPVVPVDLATTAGKTFAPTSAIATPGASVAASLTGSNDSNATVDTLVIQDPVDPGASPNPFTMLGFVGFGTVTPPTGATGPPAYEVYVDGAWVTAPGGTLPAGVDAADVRGTRVTFTGAIPEGASATVVLDLEVTDAAAASDDGTVVHNTVRSEVGLGGDAATDDDAADFTLRQNAVTVGAGKTFDPAVVVAGESSTVTLDATNTSAIAIESLTIREPSTGGFPDTYDFAGITGPIDAPSPSAGGSVVYHYADGSTQTVSFADGTTPPPADDPAGVAFFEVVFDGPIDPGSSTSVGFRVDTDPDVDPATLPLAQNNEVLVTGSNQGVDGTATADDDLYVYDEVVQPYVGKTVRPSQIPAVPGQIVTVSLQGGLTERPDPPDRPEGSTGDAQQIVIQDPQDPIVGNAWWNAFDVTAITQTPVPADAELTVEYYDTTEGQWRTLAGPIAGPTIYSAPVSGSVQDVAGGIRFVYDWTGDPSRGFPPGTDLAPNFTSELRPTGRYTPGPPFDDDAPTVVPNCAQSAATASTPGVDGGTATMPTADCPEVELIPTDPGTADIVDKEFGTSSSGGLKSVIARSGDTIPSTLSWSTAGFTGIDRMEITDVAAPGTTPLTQSFFNAFDLTRVEPITAATDPFILYDQVQQVLLWNGTAWVDAANDPCPSACIGQFPGMSLTTGERSTTTGVRLVFVESPDRATVAAGDLNAPPVGSGVARSSGNARHITLTWQVRDTRRSDGTPVLGDELYNLPDEGVVHNTVRAQGFPQPGGTALSSDDADDVVIVDVPITTTTDKNWAGGPLAVPPIAVIDPTQYPLSRITVTTRNTTPARVDQLMIADPAPGSVVNPGRGPFDAFRLNNFVRIDVPVGTTTTLVTLACPDGSTVGYTRADALALTRDTMPCDVTGVTVEFDGRIASAAAGVLEYDVRLRAFWRDTLERVTPADSPILNTAQGVAADVDPAGACPPPDGARYACDRATAAIALEEPSFGVVAGKSISPAEQKEDDVSPVTVTLTGQPTGSARTVTMALEDADPTFWNAVDFVGLPSFALPAPLGLIQACYLDGGDFTDANVTAGTVGGTWTCQPADEVAGVAEATAFLAAAPATLHGVRFVVSQTNGLGWTNPYNPVVSIPFQVVRRDTLRTGEPTPTTRADQVPAPGEAEAGIFTDTMTVHSESVNITPGVNMTADAAATAEYRNLHLEAAITVTKSPNGDVQPGVAIPYTLSFRNAGELAFVDPVFRDRLPTDADGAQLILDPDRDPSVPPWTFALTGAAPTPPNGPALPTDPDDVDVVVGADVIEFRMPAGSVLEPGQTYTITIQLMLRPGLTPADRVRNWAAIEVDVPLDACVPRWDPLTSECRDDSVVSPLAVPALSTVKKVKADSPVAESGIPAVLSTASGYDCAGTADADGFYRYPCVPMTLPGDTETWKFTVTNAGTLPIDRVVSIDNLPTPGDQGLIVVLPRGSQWQPTNVGDIRLSGAPAGTTLETYYSTSSTPCTADLNPLGTQCAPGAWQPLDASVDGSVVRSVKFVAVFPDDDPLLPGESYDVEFVTRTTPGARVDSRYPIAFNTVSTGGSAVNGPVDVTVPGTEGRRVGVAYPTGPIELRKLVTGPGAGFAPDEFSVQLTCTSVGADIGGIPASVLVPAADPVEIDGLPWGAECTATEGDNGQTSAVIGTATVGGPDDEIGLVTVTNVFDVGALDITKTVDSDATDAGGEPIAYGPFTFTVACTFLGDPVFADGYSASAPMTATIADGDTWSLTGLPVGAECTVTETNTGGAGSTEIVVTENGVEQPPIDGTAADVTIARTTRVAVTATNFFGAGDLALRKLSDGDAADDFGAGPFTLHVLCTLEGRTVWDGDVTIVRDQMVAIEDIAAGAECTVTETDAAGATAVAIDPGTVTVDEGQLVTVTVTNTFDAGSLVVTKVVDGDGAPLYGAGPFEVTLTCLEGARRVDIPGGAVRELSAANGYSTTFSPLLVGLLCSLRETDAAGATSTTITDADGAPVGLFRVAGQELALTVTNTFDLGSLVVTKTVSGADAASHRSDEFAVTLACVLDGVTITIPGGSTRAFTTAAPAEYDELPVGAQCVVTETSSGGASAVTMTPGDPDDPASAVVTIGADAAVTVTVDNRFDAAVLPLTGAESARAGVLAVLALLALGAGALLVVRRRRRDA